MDGVFTLDENIDEADSKHLSDEIASNVLENACTLMCLQIARHVSVTGELLFDVHMSQTEFSYDVMANLETQMHKQGFNVEFVGEKRTSGLTGFLHRTINRFGCLHYETAFWLFKVDQSTRQHNML